MKLLIFKLLAFTSFYASNALSATESFKSIGHGHKFVFDAEDGHFEESYMATDCPVNALRATVHIERYGMPTTEFQPGVNAYLIRGADKNLHYAKLGFHATSFRPPFQVKMEAGDPIKYSSLITFQKQTGNSSWFSFELHWTSAGVVEGVVDGQSGKVNMRGLPEQLHLMGFSGAGTVWVQFGQVHVKGDKDICRPMA